ncbi:MAG: PD-(D/E)XK nuclease family protein, partial [Lachnospiraceae bacterium]|nr:PD-(D/E)XK nuclease family protein [Lachnospiraceae bacterium]
VRLMTIHHSKGLEFPVVIVCDLQRGFHMGDLSDRLMTDDVLGAGADIIDIKRRTKKKTFVKELIRLRKENALIGEELRVLYVAMTRAEQKLILVSSGEVDEEGNGFQRTALKAPASVTDAGSFGKLLDLSLDVDGAVAGYIKTVSGSCEDLVVDAVERAADEAFLKKDFILKAEAYEGDEDEEIKRKIGTVFYHADSVNIPEKLSVSYIKHEAMEEAGAKISALETQKTVPVPGFITGSDQKPGAPNPGALRGTAYHAFFEHLDLERMSDEEEIKKQLEEIEGAGILDEKEAGYIDTSDILAFAKTKLAARMKKAAQNGCLFREQPFVILVKASEIDPSYPDDEKIMVQGIIDAYFVEDGRAVIMDYKTDRAEAGEELVKKYKAQLDYYAKAIRQLTGMEVFEEIIYSVTLKEEIVVS